MPSAQYHEIGRRSTPQLGASGIIADNTAPAEKRLGRQLAEARLKRKLTQQQVAKLSRIDQADISNIERGVANPTLGTLSAVAMAVGMEIDLRKRR